MKACILEQIADNRVQCQFCKNVWTFRGDIKNFHPGVCPAQNEGRPFQRKFEPTEKQKAIKQTTQDAKAQNEQKLLAQVEKHLAEGGKHATREDIEERLAICRKCRHFNGVACKSCGSCSQQSPLKLSMMLTQVDVPVTGPGDYLHDQIKKWVAEVPDKNCDCEPRIKQMNLWKARGCLLPENLKTIVGWLQEEGEKRGWKIAQGTFARVAITEAVRLAIRLAKKSEVSAPAYPLCEIWVGEKLKKLNPPQDVLAIHKLNLDELSKNTG
jgi:hypothetical protein